MEDADRAVMILTRAITQAGAGEPTTPLIWYELGRTFKSVGEMEKAAFAFACAVQVDPGSKVRDKADVELTQLVTNGVTRPKPENCSSAP